MSFHDLRSFLSRLETSGQLQRVDAPVSPHLESTALSLQALRVGDAHVACTRGLHQARHAEQRIAP